MKAVTIWQPWASLIMVRAKPYEFRRWLAPRAIVGQRIAIHAGARPVKPREVADLLERLRAGDALGTALDIARAMPLLERVAAEPTILPLGSVLGTAVLDVPRRAATLFAGVADSDRIDQHVWAWPLSAIEVFAPFVPARGAQGFWEWTPSSEAA